LIGFFQASLIIVASKLLFIKDDCDAEEVDIQTYFNESFEGYADLQEPGVPLALNGSIEEQPKAIGHPFKIVGTVEFEKPLYQTFITAVTSHYLDDKGDTPIFAIR